MSTFEIIEVNEAGFVKVKYSDNKVQTISNMPVTDADALVAALTEYGIAYEAGLAAVAPVAVAPEVTDLVGVKVDIVVPDPVVTE